MSLATCSAEFVSPINGASVFVLAHKLVGVSNQMAFDSAADQKDSVIEHVSARVDALDDVEVREALREIVESLVGDAVDLWIAQSVELRVALGIVAKLKKLFRCKK